MRLNKEDIITLDDLLDIRAKHKSAENRKRAFDKLLRQKSEHINYITFLLISKYNFSPRDTEAANDIRQIVLDELWGAFKAPKKVKGDIELGAYLHERARNGVVKYLSGKYAVSVSPSYLRTLDEVQRVLAKLEREKGNTHPTLEEVQAGYNENYSRKRKIRPEHLKGITVTTLKETHKEHAEAAKKQKQTQISKKYENSILIDLLGETLDKSVLHLVVFVCKLQRRAKPRKIDKAAWDKANKEVEEIVREYSAPITLS